MYRVWTTLLLLLIFSSVVHAQSADESICLTLVNSTLNQTQTACQNQPDLSLCYGHSPFAADFINADVDFNEAGNSAILSEVVRINSSAPDINQGEWGTGRLQVRLNYTDDRIAMLILGDVILENTGQVESDVPTTMLRVTTAQGLNVRAEPTESADLLGVVITGNQIRATGRLSDNSWIRLQLATGEHGWATSTGFAPESFDNLLSVEADSQLTYGSMQSFSIETGDYDPDSCRFIPPNGMLVQTPADVENARLEVNAIPLNIFPETTLFLSQSGDEVLHVDVLEGQVDMTTVAPLLVEAGDGISFNEGALPIPTAYDVTIMPRLPFAYLPRPIYATIDFTRIIMPARRNVDPLAGLGMNDDCTIAATFEAANLRELPAPDARVRRVLQIGESAKPDARAEGADGVLWWRLAPQIWVNSNAVGALGDCGTLPVLPPKAFLD